MVSYYFGSKSVRIVNRTATDLKLQLDTLRMENLEPLENK
jgi:hypothetical protein